MSSGLEHPSETESPISVMVCPEGRRGAVWAASALSCQRLERQKHPWAPQLDGVPVSWRHIILTLSLPVLLTSWTYRSAGLVFRAAWALFAVYLPFGGLYSCFFSMAPLRRDDFVIWTTGKFTITLGQCIYGLHFQRGFETCSSVSLAATF